MSKDSHPTRPPLHPPDLLLAAIAIAGFLGVTLGAFGAHALAEHLRESGRQDVWQTAVLYHLIHAAAALGVVGVTSGRAESIARAAAVWWLCGIAIFSGSLYLLAYTDVGRFGAITPIGGVVFLIGWLMLFRAAFRR